MTWISFFPLLKLLFAILIQGILVRAVVTDTDTFAYANGNVQTWTVPFNVHSIQLVVKGASAGTGEDTTGSTPGKGGIVECDLAVTSGTLINIYVGGKGANGDTSNSNHVHAGGWNGGGNGYGSGTGGGGASDIRIGGTDWDDRKVVAGGGGGVYAGGNCGGVQHIGGNGGDPNGDAGSTSCGSTAGGGGGTTTRVGTAGAGGATAGATGVGGTGDSTHDHDAGGGGGGYYGGKWKYCWLTINVLK
jgi:hypothetical protein